MLRVIIRLGIAAKQAIRHDTPLGRQFLRQAAMGVVLSRRRRRSARSAP
jgi:hypothetical protein